MRNVIVFAVGRGRYAVELRWVREVFTLGHVTPVPRAPSGLLGVVNFRGAIVPVLDVTAFRTRSPQAVPPVESHDSGVLIEVDETLAALRTSGVVEVSSLASPDDIHSDQVVDSSGQTVAVVDPPAILRRAQQAATTMAQVTVRPVR